MKNEHDVMRRELRSMERRRARRRLKRRNAIILNLLLALSVVAVGLTGFNMWRAVQSERASAPAGVTISALSDVFRNVQAQSDPDREDEPAKVVPTERATEPATEAPTPAPTPTPTLAPRSARLRAVGDIMIHEGLLTEARQPDGTYDFGSIFAAIAPVTQDADYTLAQLVTTLGQYRSQPYSGYPTFNTPESLLDALQASGFDFLSLASNHMLDRWFTGLQNTVSIVENAGFDFAGAARTPEERSRADIVTIQGIRFGFLAYTQNANGMELSSDDAATTYGVYWLRDDFSEDIGRLREAGAEIVVVYAHWGEEYASEPSPAVRAYGQALVDAGADIVLGGRAHVVQSVEMLERSGGTGAGDTALVAWSLGSFVTAQHTHPGSDSGIVLEIQVTKRPNGTFDIALPEYLATFCMPAGRSVTVIPAATAVEARPDGMDDDFYTRMVRDYQANCALLDNLKPLTP